MNAHVLAEIVTQDQSILRLREIAREYPRLFRERGAKLFAHIQACVSQRIANRRERLRRNLQLLERVRDAMLAKEKQLSGSSKDAQDAQMYFAALRNVSLKRLRNEPIVDLYLQARKSLHGASVRSDAERAGFPDERIDALVAERLEYDRLQLAPDEATDATARIAFAAARLLSKFLGQDPYKMRKITRWIDIAILVLAAADPETDLAELGWNEIDDWEAYEERRMDVFGHRGGILSYLDGMPEFHQIDRAVARQEAKSAFCMLAWRTKEHLEAMVREGLDNRLNDRHVTVLQAIVELGACDSDRRKDSVEIARRAFGTEKARDELGVLVELGYLVSMIGRSGGYWYCEKAILELQKRGIETVP